MIPTLSQTLGDAGAVHPLTIDTPTIAELARRCHEESAHYRRHEPYDERPAYELFRRAIVEGSDAAWAAIYAHYAGMVRHWLAMSEENDDAVAAVFERFWHAVDAAKFAHFTSLAAILHYLKACAYSVRADGARGARRDGDVTPFDEAIHALAARDNVEDAVCDSADAAHVWRIVRTVLNDERERQVAYLSYVAGLTPREIYARHGERFADIAEVYRLKRAVLSRLRRSPRLRALTISL